MLMALESENITNAIVVVTRYFGGIKLGTGGLSRAYSQATRDCLKLCNKAKFVQSKHLECKVSMADSSRIYKVIDSFNTILSNNVNIGINEVIIGNEIQIISDDFDESNAIIKIKVPVDSIDEFKANLIDVYKGNIEIVDIVNSELLY